MSEQSQELAWDITDWDSDADLSYANIHHNMVETFWKDGLTTPASIVCRLDQKRTLMRDYKPNLPDGTNITSITLDGLGIFKLKVIDGLERKEVTYQRGVRL